MSHTIVLNDLAIEVVKKNIKNIHLSVYPPKGHVRIAAPLRMSIDHIRIFAIAKLNWIKQQQKKFQQQERISPREYLDRESHYIWGKRYLLKIIECNQKPCIELKHKQMLLRLHSKYDNEKKRLIVEAWYRQQLKQAATKIIAKWEPILDVKVKRLFVQKMRTKWGSCNNRVKNIRLNTELISKPLECLEYVVVHEMLHLLEPTHNQRFLSLLNQYIPKWHYYRERLNNSLLEYEQWKY